MFLPRSPISCLFLLAALTVSGCREPLASVSAESAPTERSDGTRSEDNLSGGTLRLASTTSTRDSGLFEVLLPVFERQTKSRVDVVAVGTGAALKLSENGDVDAVLVHARPAEEAFMQSGHGVRHEPVMHNFFIIAGPSDDPAGVAELGADEALKQIASSGHQFVSRGDDSGTHKKELAIWKAAGGLSKWDGYLEAGQGMGPTLVIADEKNAYVLTDQGTWLKRRDSLRLKSLVEGTEDLRNPYAVMVVNPERHSAINDELTSAFADFLISEQAQKLIADYRVNGQPLFYPDRIPTESAE